MQQTGCSRKVVSLFMLRTLLNLKHLKQTHFSVVLLSRFRKWLDSTKHFQKYHNSIAVSDGGRLLFSIAYR